MDSKVIDDDWTIRYNLINITPHYTPRQSLCSITLGGRLKALHQFCDCEIETLEPLQSLLISEALRTFFHLHDQCTQRFRGMLQVLRCDLRP